MTTANTKNKVASKPAASLYFGKVTHARLKPKIHRFNYNIFSLVIDLDRYQEAKRSSFLFGVNTAALISFHEKDHGARDGSALRDYINNLLLKGDIEKPAKVLLWCNPRVFGYTFNPLSIYFCYDKNDEVIALVYQVNNTFGETHSYVAKVSEDQEKIPAIKNSAQKCFYVSPFLDMNLRYDFSIQAPKEALKVRILEHDETGPILSATFSGKHKTLNSKNLMLGMLKTLGLTWKITAGIHFEALILWFKGVKLTKRPAPPVKPSYMKQDNKIVAGE
jgi:DUF1365 family protein